jgi:hypothetical protein
MWIVFSFGEKDKIPANSSGLKIDFSFIIFVLEFNITHLCQAFSNK